MEAPNPDNHEARLENMLKQALEKLQDHEELIKLLQTHVDFQNNRINQQESKIQDLTNKVDELSKLSTNQKQIEEEKEEDDNGIWKGTKNLSLADAVKETAEQTLMTNAGFVFDSKSGLYCNYSTGYYYDPNQCLYYNGHTGVYYTYNADKQEYVFHSQVKIPSTESNCERSKKKSETNLSKSADSKKTKTKEKCPKKDQDETSKAIPRKLDKSDKTPNAKALTNSIDPFDVEEGELSDSSEESDQEDEMKNSASASDMESEEYPPCIRAIVLESSSGDIKKGSLFLVTCMGGTVGREGFHHAIMLSDPKVNKSHAKIQYMSDPSNPEIKTEKYFIADEGSRTGTFLNGKRLSDEKLASEFHEIPHGSTLKIGGFSILMHIHPGSFTCGHCEPGLLIEPDQVDEGSQASTIEKGKSRNAMMRQIKRKYGINGPKQMPETSENYTDRAQERRIIKGSDNPYEKTQVATLDESIGKSNKGFKMLSKMGWSTGTSLGQTGEQGLLEPINLELKSGRGGLGLSSSSGDVLRNGSPGIEKSKHATSKPKQSRVEQLAITMKRFKEAEGTGVDLDDNEASS